MGAAWFRAIAGILAAGCIAALLAMFFEPFWQEVLRQLGVNTAAWVAPMLMFLSSKWFPHAAMFIIGLASGAWLHWLLSMLDRRREGLETVSDTIIYANRSVLRLRVSGKSETPHEIYHENIKNWYSFYTKEIRFDGLSEAGDVVAGGLYFPPDWLFVVRFERPVKYRQIHVHFYNCQPPSCLVHQQTEDSVLVWVNAPLPQCEMEIRTSS